MKKFRWSGILVVLLLLWAGWNQGWFGRSKSGVPPATYRLDRDHRVVYTRHARCRMGCRHINAQEVREIIASGTIDPTHSDPQDKPCPTVALEGYSRQHQHIRLIVATCGDELRLVTCIDLEKQWPCDCP